MNVEEAKKLVKIHGLEQSKEIVANCPPECTHYSWQLGETGVLDKTICVAELKQALNILDKSNEKI